MHPRLGHDARRAAGPAVRADRVHRARQRRGLRGDAQRLRAARLHAARAARACQGLQPHRGSLLRAAACGKWPSWGRDSSAARPSRAEPLGARLLHALRRRARAMQSVGRGSGATVILCQSRPFVSLQHSGAATALAGRRRQEAHGARARGVARQVRPGRAAQRGGAAAGGAGRVHRPGARAAGERGRGRQRDGRAERHGEDAAAQPRDVRRAAVHSLRGARLQHARRHRPLGQ